MKTLSCIILLSIACISCFASDYVKPAGGWNIEAGKSFEIQWNNTTIVSPVKIELWNVNTQSYSTIADSCCQSTYQYIFPDSLTDNLLRIRITSLQMADQFQMSDSYFTVIPQSDSLNKKLINNTINCQIFPNPASNMVNIQYNQNCKKLSAVLSDCSGNIVQTFPIVNNYRSNTCKVFTIHPILANGAYFLRISADDNTLTKEIIINR